MVEIASRQAAAVAAGNKMKNHEALGRIHNLTISSPAVAAWAQNDTISSPVKLPPGTRIMDCKVFHEAMGAGVSMDIGLRQTDSDQTVVDVDGIADGIDVASAGISDANNGELVDENSPEGYVTTVETNVYATLLGANPTDNAQFRIDLKVCLPG